MGQVHVENKGVYHLEETVRHPGRSTLETVEQGLEIVIADVAHPPPSHQGTQTLHEQLLLLFVGQGTEHLFEVLFQSILTHQELQ